MTDKHTPGPWTLQYTGPAASKASRRVMKEPGGCSVCTIESWVKEANARLIALAPEMATFIHRVAFGPLGDPELSASGILDILTVEGQDLLSRINSKGGE